jgi:hypothetical protein
VAFPVRLSVPSGLAVTVHCDTQPGTARAADYTARHQVLTLTAGRTVGFVSVPVVGDALNEANEKFSLALSRPVGAKIGTATAAATINDDDPVPTVSIGDGGVVEGDSGELTTISFPLTLSAKSGRPITLAYTTADDTAQAPGDYLAASGTVTIKAGTVESSISVPVVGDELIEGDERFALDLSAPLHVTIDRAEATGTVHDDESPPQISVTDTHVTEGDGGSVAAQFTVSLSVPSSNAVSVDYATADGTATAPADYSATSGTITFAPGRTEETIDVPVIGDALIETDETFTLTLTNPGNATLGTATATGTIADDDSRPAVSVSNAPDVSEGDSGTIDAVFSVSLDATTTRDVSVDFATVDSSAVAPDDYLATSGTATIPAGSTGTTIAVPVVGDTRYESVEIFSLQLSNPVNSTLGTDSASATVVDDDPPPTITISNNVVVTEGDTDTTDAVFTVQLSGASGLTTTADFRTSDITASAPADYASSSGTVTIRPGATSATFSVPVNGDALYEGDERFLVVLADATNGTVSDDDYGAYGIIEDDDPAPTISVAEPAVAEGDSGTTNAVLGTDTAPATIVDDESPVGSDRVHTLSGPTRHSVSTTFRR